MGGWSTPEAGRRYRQERAARLRALGLCANCGEPVGDPCRANCDRCLAVRRERHRTGQYRRADPAAGRALVEERRALGLCFRCGAALDTDSSRCADCRRAHREWARRAAGGEC